MVLSIILVVLVIGAVLGFVWFFERGSRKPHSKIKTVMSEAEVLRREATIANVNDLKKGSDFPGRTGR